MSAFSDLIHGNFGNIGHDLAADPVGTGIGALGLTALTAGLAAPALLGGEGALAGLFGAGEAGAAAAGGAGSALAFAPEGAGLAGSEGVGAIESLLAGGGGAGGEAAPLGLDYGAGGIVSGAETALPAAAGGGEGAGAAGGGTSFIDQLLGGAKSAGGAIGSQIMKNPLGIGAAALGAGLNFRNAGATTPNQQALQGQAGALNAQGQKLTAEGQAFTQYLASGTLPPGMQAAVDKATAAAKATAISNAAKNGLATDPTQNTALADQLAAIDRDALIAVAQGGESLFKAGMSEIGAGVGAETASSQLYAKLIQIDQDRSNRMGTAIANFARSLNGGLTLGGSKNG